MERSSPASACSLVLYVVAAVSAALLLSACASPEPEEVERPAVDLLVLDEALQRADRAEERVRNEIRGDRERNAFAALDAVPEAKGYEATQCREGLMGACENLADMFAAGIGVKKDAAKAQALYDRVYDLARTNCDDGHAHGCAMLGRVYYEGLGIQQDRKKGAELLRRSCADGDPLACQYVENEGID